MGSAYIFTLQPTFTQGLILGQVSILFLLVVILKYLFFDPISTQPYKATSYQPRVVREDEYPVNAQDQGVKAEVDDLQGRSEAAESAGWLNMLLHHVCIMPSFHDYHSSYSRRLWRRTVPNYGTIYLGWMETN